MSSNNSNLHVAKKEKNDEFYTQFYDIENEMMAYIDYNPDVFRGKTILLPCDDPEWSNFTLFFAQRFSQLGIKKLISTSYAPNAKKRTVPYTPSLFELESENYDESKNEDYGKIFILEKDITGDGTIDFDDLQWQYLEGDGDFRSEEVCKLRDEADIIITNPPFSLFREFIAWIYAAKTEKQYAVIGSINAITYKEIFPLIKENKMWLGSSIHGGTREFRVPDDFIINAPKHRVAENGERYVRVDGIRWFTNIDYQKRHTPLSLMSMEDNIRFSKHKDIRENGYPKFDNYDAINVNHTDAIPSDYEGVMGVPISFLDKYCPEQFEIVEFRKGADGKDLVYSTGGGARQLHTSEYLSDDASSRADEQSKRHISEREIDICQNTHSSTSIPGMIKNAEGVINGKATYARILIRKVK